MQFVSNFGLSAKDLTVVGTVVAGRSQGEVELENARVLAQPSVTQPSSGQVRGGNYTVIGSGRGRQASTYRCFPAEQVTSGVPAFHFQVIPTNGGYPVRLVFTPGTEPNVASMNTTLYAPDDWAQLETSLAGAVSIPEQFLRLILQGMVDAVGSGGTTTTEPETAVNLLGDLSRFLPFEERVRVVSWIER